MVTPMSSAFHPPHSDAIQVVPLCSWQEELGQLITSPEQLLEELELPFEILDEARRAANLFPLRVPRPYLSRIIKGDLNDPLLRQVMPLGIEANATEGFTSDPLAEKEANPVPGIIHKYHGRLLLIAAPQCAINCRYCFRREFDYGGNTPSREQWQTALSYIRNDESIEEVIMSGGDPLTLNDRQLSWLFNQIEKIPHVTRLRIHTRLPIVIPARITKTLLKNLAALTLQTVVVVHCNHPQEIDTPVQQSLVQLKSAGVTVFNQSVLLKSINDSANILVKLSKRLFTCGVIPYYLHQLDRVSGAAHFEVSDRKAKDIYRHMLAELPGYLMPKLVREEAGASSKSPL